MELVDARAQPSGPPIQITSQSQTTDMERANYSVRIAWRTRHTSYPRLLEALSRYMIQGSAPYHYSRYKLTVVEFNRGFNAPFRGIYHSVNDHLSDEISQGAWGI